MSIQVWLATDEKINIDLIDYTHDYALELIKPLTKDDAQAEAIKKS